MTERWVCKRCFADNNDTDAQCVNCGLGRGAEVPESDQSAWAAGQPTPAWRALLRFWWIPAMLIFLAVGYFASARRGGDGSVEAGGMLTVDNIQVGDCFDVGEEEFSDVDAVPCGEPHTYEAFLIQGATGSEYPTDAQMEELFLSSCVPAFESYVGVPYADSEIYASMFTPTTEAWDAGDRQIICYVFEPDESFAERVVTGSLRGAAR